MHIEIDKTTVEQAVANAVVDSAIGAKIKVAVTTLLSKGWDNPIDKAIEQVIAEISLKMIRDEYAVQIREAVKSKMADTTIDEMVERFWNKVIER